MTITDEMLCDSLDQLRALCREHRIYPVGREMLREGANAAVAVAEAKPAPVAVEWVWLPDGPDNPVADAAERLRDLHGCTFFRATHVGGNPNPDDYGWLAVEGWLKQPEDQGAPPTEADIPRGFV